MLNSLKKFAPYVVATLISFFLTVRDWEMPFRREMAVLVYEKPFMEPLQWLFTLISLPGVIPGFIIGLFLIDLRREFRTWLSLWRTGLPTILTLLLLLIISIPSGGVGWILWIAPIFLYFFPGNLFGGVAGALLRPSPLKRALLLLSAFSAIFFGFYVSGSWKVERRAFSKKDSWRACQELGLQNRQQKIESAKTILSYVTKNQELITNPRFRYAIKALGPASIDPILSALQNEEKAIRAELLRNVPVLRPDDDQLPMVSKRADLSSEEAVSYRALILGTRPDIDNVGIESLIKDLRQGTVKAKTNILIGLGRIGKMAEPAISEVAGLTTHRDPGIRQRAVIALGKIGIANQAARQVIGGLLPGNDNTLRTCLDLARLQLENGGQAAFDQALHEVNSSSGEAHAAARLFLEQAGPGDAAAVPAIARAIALPNEPVQRAAFSALEQIGPGALDAIPQLLDVPGNFGLQLQALSIIAAMGTDVVPILLKKVMAESPPIRRNSNPDDRDFALQAIGRIGPEAKIAVPGLIEVCQNRPRYRHSAARALSAIGTKEAIAAYRKYSDP